MKADLLWWQAFLDDWDGLQLLRQLDGCPTFHIWTDASGRLEIGGYILQHLSDPV